MANLILLCGISGSGKSTLAQDANYFDQNTTKWVSRDKIRFAHLNEGEHYFSHEDEVKSDFFNTCTKYLREGFNVIVDQTNMTPKARKEARKRIHGYDKLIAIWLDTPVKKCISNNENRTGRAHVPVDVIKEMDRTFIPPTFNEKFDAIYQYKNFKLYEIKKGV